MGGMQEIELPVRLAGRLIVLDPGRRILLFRYDDRSSKSWHWATPGGGADPGEDHYAAACRELTEETGWADVPVRPGTVFERWVILDFGGRAVRQHERYFLARVPVDQRPLGDVAAMHRSDGIRAARWWTAAELDTTDEAVFPERLADRIREISPDS